jgi:hypothetical protein
MPPTRSVPAADEVEDGEARLGRRREPLPIEQLAVEGREEALAERVVVGITHRAHRGPDTGRGARTARRRRASAPPWAACATHSTRWGRHPRTRRMVVTRWTAWWAVTNSNPGTGSRWSPAQTRPRLLRGSSALPRVRPMPLGHRGPPFSPQPWGVHEAGQLQCVQNEGRPLGGSISAPYICSRDSGSPNSTSRSIASPNGVDTVIGFGDGISDNICVVGTDPPHGHANLLRGKPASRNDREKSTLAGRGDDSLAWPRWRGCGATSSPGPGGGVARPPA